MVRFVQVRFVDMGRRALLHELDVVALDLFFLKDKTFLLIQFQVLDNILITRLPGDHRFADACQCEEGYLANTMSQKTELHTPLLHKAALLAMLLEAVPECLQQALPPDAGRK